MKPARTLVSSSVLPSSTCGTCERRKLQRTRRWSAGVAKRKAARSHAWRLLGCSEGLSRRRDRSFAERPCQERELVRVADAVDGGDAIRSELERGRLHQLSFVKQQEARHAVELGQSHARAAQRSFGSDAEHEAKDAVAPAD